MSFEFVDKIPVFLMSNYANWWTALSLVCLSKATTINNELVCRYTFVVYRHINDVQTNKVIDFIFSLSKKSSFKLISDAECSNVYDYTVRKRLTDRTIHTFFIARR